MTAYELFYLLLETGSATDIWYPYDRGTTNLDSLTQVVSTLTQNKNYRFKVRAKRGNAQAGDYSPISQYYIATVPAQMSFDSADTEFGGWNITLHWTEQNSVSATDLPILGYRIYSNEGYLADDYSLYKDLDSADITEITVTGLTPGNRYRFKITAYNAVGESVLSTALKTYAMTKPGTPSAPMREFPDGISSTHIKLSWDPVINTGFVPLTGYKVRMMRVNCLITDLGCEEEVAPVS